MKQGTQLLFLFVLLAISCRGVIAAGGRETFDVDKELRNNTYYIQELDQGRKGYHAYFQDDGTLAIKFSPKHWKYERWQVDDKGTLCMTTIARRVGKTTMYTSKCGRFIRSSDTAYRWFNGDGQHRANFILKGNGERLPGLGQQAALEADVVLAQARTTAKVRKAKIRELRPRLYKSRK